MHARAVGALVCTLFAASAALSSCTLAGCGNDGPAGLTKKDYEDSIAELTEPVALIAVHLPYLDKPKSEGKYDPRPKARDVPNRSERAANAIRFAATSARQRAKSPVTKELKDLLNAVARDCTEALEDAPIAKCKLAINALDAELEKKGKAASEAGAAGKMPRINPEAITDRAKKELELYTKALGPTPKESSLLKNLEKADADVIQMIGECHEAAEEQKEITAATYENKDEDMRKLSVVHMFAIEAICRSLERVEALRNDLLPCKEKKNKETPECVLACSKAKNLIVEGMPAAALEVFPTQYKETCEEEDKNKKP
jgi:hypothetical protein